MNRSERSNIMYKIYLSPSQQANKYAVGDTTEQIQCNKIAESTEKYLKCVAEFEIKRAPFGQTMAASIKESNNWDADIHIPIHTNASNGRAGGTLVMIYDNSSRNKQLGIAIYNRVDSVCPGETKYGVQVNNTLAELNSTGAIAAYVECDFHDNPKIAQFIIDNTDLIGKAIAQGICDYYNVKLPEPNEKVTYYVQTGAFTKKENAEKLIRDLKEYGFNAIIKTSYT